MTAFALVALLVTFPPDHFKCTVRGTAYAVSGHIDLPVRTDGCLMVKQEVRDNGLILHLGQTWVLIPFPKSGGHLHFAYRWGSLVATISGVETAIAYGVDDE
jgi:hypothetical protein